MSWGPFSFGRKGGERSCSDNKQHLDLQNKRWTSPRGQTCRTCSLTSDIRCGVWAATTPPKRWIASASKIAGHGDGIPIRQVETPSHSCRNSVARTSVRRSVTCWTSTATVQGTLPSRTGHTRPKWSVLHLFCLKRPRIIGAFSPICEKEGSPPRSSRDSSGQVCCMRTQGTTTVCL